jgi:hypothetical protein
VIANSGPNHAAATGFVYFEVLIDVAGIYGGMIGMAARGHASGYSFPGHSAQSWGYYGVSGAKYHAGGSAAYGATFASDGKVVGVIWKPSTGGLWFSLGGVVQGGGNPENGTGAAYTNVTGDLVPAISPYGARLRLRTHAHEQVHRPSYCTAWDGADLLPELHFRGTLAEAPRYRRGISVWPWERRRSGGSPISALELHNRGGRYDGLALADLRDEPVRGYWQEASALAPVRQFYTRADRVELGGADRARVLLRDRSALLDKHLDKAACLFGFVRVAGVALTGARDFIVSHHPYTTFTVKDGGNTVTNWVHLPVTNGAGFRRTVAPTKRTCAYEVRHYRKSALLPLTNSNFAAWTADNPDGWTPTETAPNNIVTQSAGRARFVRANPGSTVKIVGTLTGTPAAVNFLRVVVSSFVSGSVDVTLYAAGVAKATANIQCGDGEYWIPLQPSGGVGAAPYTLEIAATAGTDLCVDDVEFWTATAAINSPYSTIIGAAQLLLEDTAGFTSSEWTYDNHFGFAWYSSPVGTWSDARPLLRASLETLLDGVLGDWYTDADDVLHLAQLPVPSSGLSRATLTASDILELEAEDDTAPALSDFLRTDLNFSQHAESDIDGVLYTSDPVLAGYLRTPGFDMKASYIASFGAGALDPFYSHALTGQPRELSLTYGGSPAIVQALDIRDHWTTRRRFFRAVVKRAALTGRRPSDVVTIEWPRYGLASGLPVAIVEIDGTFTGPTVNVLFWG